MSNLGQLVNYIKSMTKDYGSANKILVREKAIEINSYWDWATAQRGLRDRKDIQGIYAGESRKSPITGWRYIGYKWDIDKLRKLAQKVKKIEDKEQGELFNGRKRNYDY